jgi:hypothetical protein
MMKQVKRIASITAALLLAAIMACCVILAIPKHDFFIERVGTPLHEEHTEESHSGARHHTVTIRSSTGLEVRMRILRPDMADEQQVPLILVLGGQATGRDAVDLVGKPDGVAFAAIDYPYGGGQHLDGFWESVSAIPSVQQAFLDSPPALSLALTWLLQQPWVDSERVELAGVSLGVPFVAVAGALDERFTRIWLLHGGGDNAVWVSHNAQRRIENELLRNIVARAALFAVYGNSFDTRRWIPEIAPRPLIIVAAKDDDFVPRAAQQPLIEAAESEFVELLWTDGRHIGPSRGDELQQLLDVIRRRVSAVDAAM